MSNLDGYWPVSIGLTQTLQIYFGVAPTDETVPQRARVHLARAILKKTNF